MNERMVSPCGMYCSAALLEISEHSFILRGAKNMDKVFITTASRLDQIIGPQIVMDRGRK